MIDIKPCPFCGETKDIETDTDTDALMYSDTVIRCQNCGAKGPPCGSTKQAKKAWNERKQ